MNKPLFERSMLTMKIAVYPDRITYKKSMFDGERSIPIDKVASVEIGGYFSSNVTVITTAGEKINFPVIRQNKEAFKDAIYKAKEIN